MPIKDKSVQSIITSPPYWGLRKYDIPDVELGGWRGQLGLEPTPDLYIEHLMLVMAECWRVLRDDGCCFVNLGDTYGGGGDCGSDGHGKNAKRKELRYPKKGRTRPKSLCGIPQRFFLACQADGWIIRNEIIWHKPNAMPSSAKDRFSVSHEKVFMLVKAKERRGWEKVKIYEACPIDLTWLAAMIDGEGSISIGKFYADTKAGKRPRYQSGVCVNNTHNGIIKKCLAITGIGNVGEAKGTNRPIFKWQANGVMAEAVLKAVYPYLVAKKEQVKVALALQKTNLMRGNNQGSNRGPALISNEEIKYKESLYVMCKQLNQGKIATSELLEPQVDLPERFVGCNEYYFDLDAVRERFIYPNRTYNPATEKHKTKTLKDAGNRTTGGLHDGREKYGDIAKGKNPGDVWSIPTAPYPEAHYATFPEKLVERLLLCSTKPGDVVLDPFGGSGTVGRVAIRYQRKPILLDLGYHGLQAKRMNKTQVQLF